ncbi:hypothetical protein DBR37_05780 [Herminiimonas sp. KBW02]|uniref:hypothetical protein n=1 Tax=Herminiimonas sp. KBW02 TaxID=2153363 RepID=UPI000F5907F1|nr:hypothetical protein [Herminiimonas sp. KBW02]RQO35868.1 hypothetical protein DBR37_05780 [Herminiimonas sp. KBW02]
MGITVGQLRPYIRRIIARRQKNPSNLVWEVLEARWEAVVTNARNILNERERGRAMSSYQSQAAYHLVRIANDVPNAVVIATSLAMFVMREEHTRLFKTDKSFLYQLARRIRGLTDKNAGTYWDNKSGKLKLVYRDILPGTLELIAKPLFDAFAVAGVRLAELDKRDEKQLIAERERLAAAIKEMV